MVAGTHEWKQGLTGRLIGDGSEDGNGEKRRDSGYILEVQCTGLPINWMKGLKQ